RGRSPVGRDRAVPAAGAPDRDRPLHDRRDPPGPGCPHDRADAGDQRLPQRGARRGPHRASARRRRRPGHRPDRVRGDDVKSRAPALPPPPPLAPAPAAAVAPPEPPHTLAGSLQLDYLVVPTNLNANQDTFDGMTAELSLKYSVDFTSNAAASVKVCFACHGF